jgi:hypothetical protein
VVIVNLLIGLLTEGAVDASPNLHFALVYYACSRVYQRLEDVLWLMLISVRLMRVLLWLKVYYET